MVYLPLVFGDIESGQIIGRQAGALPHIGGGQALKRRHHTIDGLANEIVALRLLERKAFQRLTKVNLDLDRRVTLAVQFGIAVVAATSEFRDQP